VKDGRTQKSPNFTLGPWTAGNNYRIFGDDGSPIADVLQWSHPLQQKANASLIASAPNMYAALVDVQWANGGFCPQCAQGPKKGRQPKCLIGVALAKAVALPEESIAAQGEQA